MNSMLKAKAVKLENETLPLKEKMEVNKPAVKKEKKKITSIEQLKALANRYKKG